jgi:GNAT superfamily N-acetyltransferase
MEQVDGQGFLWMKKEVSGVQIELLADHPDWIPTIVRWHWDEWGHLDPSGTLERWTMRLAEKANRDQIPLTLVAVEQGKPAGTALLVTHDMETRKDLSPWLAGVFVLPEQRSHGVGLRLVQEAEKKAHEMGIEKLYLYTRSAVPFYEKLDWRELERCVYQGREVVIMSKLLDP